MTNRIKSNDWRNLPTERWNVTSFHAYLIEKNSELFGAEYVPFGQGSISNRWRTEKGQLKQAQGKYGNAVLRRFIERCLETHRPNPDFPHINFGYMWAFLRDEVPRAQSQIAAEAKTQKAEEEATDVNVDELRGWL